MKCTLQDVGMKCWLFSANRIKCQYPMNFRSGSVPHYFILLSKFTFIYLCIYVKQTYTEHFFFILGLIEGPNISIS